MKGDPSNPQDWRKAAERDLASARRSLAADDLYVTVYCLQQCAEKLLKGWLIGEGWNLVKTHDLERLVKDACARNTELAWFSSSAVRLTRLYFIDRYVDDSPDPEPDDAECRQLLSHVKRLHRELFPPH